MKIKNIYFWRGTNRKVPEKAIELENRSRRNNLRIDGLKENDRETWADCEEKVKALFKWRLNIQKAIQIERAHRSGKRDESRRRPRPIVLKLQNYKGK